jgi:hypothetical protein
MVVVDGVGGDGGWCRSCVCSWREEVVSEEHGVWWGIHKAS